MTTQVKNLLLRKTISVKAPPSHVFDVFVNRFDTWWPRTHHIGKTPSFTTKLEPRQGGRWYEISEDGQECDWGRVLVWEPPNRLVLTWDITASWQYDPNVANEVEVLFHAEGDGQTRVELEHRKLENYGNDAMTMFGIFDSDDGWTSILRSLASQAAATARGH